MARAPSGDDATADKPKVDVTEFEAYNSLSARFGPELDLNQLLNIAQKAVNLVDKISEPTANQQGYLNSMYEWFQGFWSDISLVLDDIDMALNDDEEEEEEKEGKEDEDSKK
jgi:hypothetical protein